MPAAHLLPLDELITETLGWFDRYLGVSAGTPDPGSPDS
jgi:hypothetical protein